MPRNYDDFKASAESVLERAHRAGFTEGNFYSEAMVYALLALAAAIHEKNNVTLNLNADANVHLI